jgi:hypothetical protein
MVMTNAANCTLSGNTGTGGGVFNFGTTAAIQGDYLAQAYASTRGSAPALRTPVFGSMAMAAFEPNDHAPADCNL